MPLINTDVLLRLVTGDNPEKAQHASDIISSYGEGELTLTDCVLIEIASVLQYNQHYRWPREAVCEALEDIAVIPQIHVSRAGRQALRFYCDRQELDFTDCLLQAQAKIDRTSIVALP